MIIQLRELNATLKKNLPPFFYLSGDEPLQLNEAADCVRQAAKQAGFSYREILEIDSKFNWKTFNQAVASYSLFDDKKIIELRLGSATPGSDGAKTIATYLENPSDDVLVLMTGPKISASTKKAKWFLELSKKAVIVQVWPLEGARLIDWIRRRLSEKGLSCDQKGLSLLASRVEGNLLAAAQEIDKLYVLHGEGVIDAKTIANLVFDHARFDVFKLLDAVLRGDAARSSKILFRLKQEGIPPPVVLWGLMKETRLLIQLSFNLRKGRAPEPVLRENKVWDNRQSLILNAAKRLDETKLLHILQLGTETDRTIKGLNNANSWNGLFTICMGLCGLDTPKQNFKAC